MNTVSMAVIGAGSYGTALAITLSRNGHHVLLWGHNPDHIQTLQRERCNKTFLPCTPFPKSLLPEVSLKTTVRESRNLLLVVPSYAFNQVLQKIQPYLTQHSRIIWATKGLEQGTGRLLKDVARETLGKTIPLAVLSGPTFAKDLADDLPTAIVISASSAEFSTKLQKRFQCGNNLRIYKNSDMTGVQLGGVVKNIIAIGAGISDGIGLGANARTEVITQGLSEIIRLGVAMGAKPSTFMGMSGLGDLVVTCTENQSRNRRFGILLGQSVKVNDAVKQIGQLVEGYLNAKEIYMLAQRFGVEMPITEQIYQILYCNKNVLEATNTLLNRDSKKKIHDPNAE